jgi:hypothetical protein
MHASCAVAPQRRELRLRFGQLLHQLPQLAFPDVQISNHPKRTVPPHNALRILHIWFQIESLNPSQTYGLTIEPRCVYRTFGGLAGRFCGCWRTCAWAAARSSCSEVRCSDHSARSASSCGNFSPLSAHFQSNFSPISAHFQSNFSPLSVHFQSTFSPIPAHFQSTFSPISAHFQSTFSPISVYV